MRPNMLLNIIGIILVLTAITGLALVEEDKPPLDIFGKIITYNIGFEEGSGAGPTDSQSVNDGSTGTFSINIDEYNLTSVEITISWSDNYPISRLAGSLSLDILVSGPGDIESVSTTESGNSGTITIEFTELNNMPNQTEFEILEDEDINEMASDNFPPTEAGRGSWQISVYIERSRTTLLSGSTDVSVMSSYNHYTMKDIEKGASE